ncbi:MAG TPA: MaoC/PaaZ C-terminal domain-containing protein [Steroidobacteraceae bacterium]|nr:MaoC/PaaZ C-terminal domain-containing protein [Steroidobacteraceae bacterium]
MRYFEDLIEGEERQSQAREVSEPELLEFARRYDPQYFHADPQAAAGSIFGGLVASGIFTMAVWRQLDHRICGDIAWICGVAWNEVRFPHPVRPGDSLRALARCVSKRPSQKDPRRGVVVFEYTLLNQRQETVFTCLSTNLIERRPGAANPQSSR